jgi:WD repeat-containing protein 42A
VDFNDENEILATYSRADVYLFSAADGLSESQVDNSSAVPVVKEYKQVYTGRRNVQTFLKEVTFFCDNSFVCTGSDCGNLFIWEKKTGTLANCLTADASVVNGVAPHPVLPVLATCGIDSDGKIFEVGDKSTYNAKYAKKAMDRNNVPERESVRFYFTVTSLT